MLSLLLQWLLFAIIFISVACGSRVRNALRNWGRIPAGFERPVDASGKLLSSRPPKPKVPIRVHSIPELKELFKKGYRVPDLDVRGNITYLLDDRTKVHPVVEALHQRKKQQSKPGDRSDGYKMAVAIEGGGMRGCIGAGMITAFSYLGLDVCIDVVYGSSAGSLVGAYFIAKQMPYEGPEVYYDVLTTAGKDFIDINSLLRSVGLGIFDFRFESIKVLFTDRLGRPVLNLNYLFDTIVKNLKPLNWECFWEQQQTKKQELKIVASGLLSHKSVTMSAADGNFKTLDEMAECMKASMMLPGIAGDAVRLKGRQAEAENIKKVPWPEYKGWKQVTASVDGEPMTDALLYEPVPYRSAIKDNCTHIIALRTRADDVKVLNKISVIEKMIMSRFFGRKLGLREMVDWMHNQYHKLIYAEDILRLNEANADFSPFEKSPRLFGIACPPGTPEVQRLETSREVIFQSVRNGFAAAYDSLVLDPAERGRGIEIAKEIWPDSILENSPAHLVKHNVSGRSEQSEIDMKQSEDVATAADGGTYPCDEVEKEALQSQLQSRWSVKQLDGVQRISDQRQISEVDMQEIYNYPPSSSELENAIMNSDARALPQVQRKALVKRIKNLQAKLLGVPFLDNELINGDAMANAEELVDDIHFLYRSASEDPNTEEEESLIDSIIDDISELGLSSLSQEADDSDGYHGIV